MFLLVQIDRKWIGFGIDWHPHVKGIRAGWLTIHWFNTRFETFIELSNLRFHNKEMEKINAQVDENLEEWMNAPIYSDVLH
ncbi:hypothetical protein D3C76_855860 [compost metagenome]